MKSLNNCVQEFLDYHSAALFPNSSTTETRQPRTSRFNSIPSSVTEIEDEDPSLFWIYPKIFNHWIFRSLCDHTTY